MREIAIGCAIALAAIWIGYPAVMRMLATLRRAPSPPYLAAGPWPSVSIVIASRDPAADINARVADALAASYAGPLEVIAALDARSATREAEIATGNPRVRVVRGGLPGGKATALNSGVQAAAGELVVFSDTHQRFAPDAIRLLASELSAGRYGATSGRLELPESAHPSVIERYWRFERRLRHDEARVHSAVGVSGSIYGLRRELWEPLPSGVILDDLFVPMRLALAGHRIGFTGAARAHDLRSTTPGEEYVRKVRTLTGIFQLCAWLPGVLVPVQNPIWVQFVFHKLLRLLTPYFGMGLAFGSAGWLYASAGWRGVAAVTLLIALVIVLAGISGKGGALFRIFRWVISMQVSIIIATANGIRGRWDVWGSRR